MGNLRLWPNFVRRNSAAPARLRAQSGHSQFRLDDSPSIEVKKTKSFFASDNYFEGKWPSMQRIIKKAIQLWSESAEQGYPEAQGLVGSMYNAGYGVPKNYEKAMTGTARQHIRVMLRPSWVLATLRRWPWRGKKLYHSTNVVRYLC